MKKLVAVLALAAFLLTGCSIGQQNSKVTIIAHDSFAISDELIAKFQEESGYELIIVRAGDAGSLTNRLVLTKGSPIADVVFGIDNTFRGIALENEVIDSAGLIEVDYADVCFNYDKDWFARNQIAPPSSWKDLTAERYRGLTVVTNPLSSSPGLAFLASTVSAFGEDGFERFWNELKANDVKVAAGWEEAYFTEFSGSVGAGKYPIVLSYSSSPAAEVRNSGESQTAALLDDCFRQVEYIGTLTGAKNPTGAKALIDFLLGVDFQSEMPGLMYVYPVNKEASIPAEWSRFGPPARSTIGSELDIESGRSTWQAKWSAIFD
jgi:thiamine transport system substrate-binding protein